MPHIGYTIKLNFQIKRFKFLISRAIWDNFYRNFFDDFSLRTDGTFTFNFNRRIISQRTCIKFNICEGFDHIEVNFSTFRNGCCKFTAFASDFYIRRNTN